MTTIGIIGGTGPQGRGLGFRFARVGHDIVVGSRDQSRAAEAAERLIERLGGKPSGSVSGDTNGKAAEIGDVVLFTLPYEGHEDVVRQLSPHLAGKLVISCVNPLGFDKRGPYGLDLGPTSAAEQTQELLPDSKVVGAFHHLSAVTLIGEADALHHEDVLVCGDDVDAKQIVIELATSITGKPGIDAGALRLARQLEPLTAVLISINKRYKVRAGVAIAGMPTAPLNTAGH